jgi:hypothetical protein
MIFKVWKSGSVELRGRNLKFNLTVICQPPSVIDKIFENESWLF